MLLLLSTEPLVWDRASCDQTRPQEPPEDASSKPSDPSAAACGLHPGSWPRPLWRAVLGGGSALAPEAPQMHQLQDCSAAPAPSEHVLGTSRRTSSSAEQPNETRWSIPSDQGCAGRAQYGACRCRKHLCDKLSAVTFQPRDKDRCKDTGFPSFQSFSFQDKTGVCRWEACTAADSLKEGTPLFTGYVSRTQGTSLNW